MRVRRGLLAAAMALLVFACTASDHRSDIPVRSSKGPLAIEQMELRVLALDEAERSQFVAAGIEGWRALAADMVIEDHLIGLADALTADDAEWFRRQMLRAARALTVERQVERWLGPLPAPSETEIEALYAARPAAGTEQRMVLHLYLSRASRSEEDLRSELAQIKARADAGVPFARLAAELSEGQARHSEGRLGWVSPGQFPQQLDDVIFSLEPGVVSRAYVTGDGGHLFLVETAIEVPEETFVEFRARAFSRLTEQRRREALDTLVSQAQAASDIWVASPANALEAVQDNRFDETLLRTQDSELTTLELFRELRAKLAGARIGLSDVGSVLSTHWRNELLFEAHAERDADRVLLANWPAAPKLRQRGLQLVGERLVAETLRAEDLRELFDRDWRRFAGPVRFDFDHYLFPTRSAPGMLALMQRLERLVATEQMTVDVVRDAQQAGYKSATLDQVAFAMPMLVPFITQCRSDSWTPPIRILSGVEMAFVRGCEEPGRPPFEDVAARVELAYLERHGQRLWKELQPSLLEQAGFEVNMDALERAVDRLNTTETAEPAQK